VQNSETGVPGGPPVVARPIGDDPEAIQALHPNLTIWEAYSAVHLLMPDGSVKVGGEAVAEVLRRLPNTKWFAWLFDVSVFGKKPFQSILNLGYYILDEIRPAFGCESCGEPPPKWAMPIAWMVQAWKWLTGPKIEPTQDSSTPPNA
jgi:hypothetical protein